MTTIKVLDSWPMLEWLKGSVIKPAVDRLLEASSAGKLALRMSAINVGEVFYFVAKYYTRDAAELWRDQVYTLPIHIEIPTMSDIWGAAEQKSQFPISYADAFALDLAKRHNAELVTGDPDFRSLPNLKLHWLAR